MTMTETTDRMEKLFFEVFEPLPRQGPGSHSSAARALDLCVGLPPSPAVLDLGCGAGAQTFHLVELTTGSIVAVDNHAPNIERLRAEVAERGLGERIHPLVGDIGKPEHEPGSFDLIWSEGALYNIGIEEALRLYHPVVKPGGTFAFTEAVWRKEDPPPEVKAAFEDYAGMGSARDALAKIEASNFSLVDHFTLPYEDWWDDFYTPMESRIEELRGKYAGDAEALAALSEIAREPEMHRRHSDYYGYEFFVVRRD
jgi:SAM-dependent methyltransferase